MLTLVPENDKGIYHEFIVEGYLGINERNAGALQMSTQILLVYFLYILFSCTAPLKVEEGIVQRTLSHVLHSCREVLQDARFEIGNRKFKMGSHNEIGRIEAVATVIDMLELNATLRTVWKELFLYL